MMGELETREVSSLAAGAARTTLGWREWLALPEMGIPAIRAKVDTGARSSALHVDSVELFIRADREWVRFSLDAGGGATPAHCEAMVIARRPVTDSGGRTTERVFIATELRMAGQRWQIEVNLTSRKQLLFPMLLGRTAMSGRFLVDPSASFLLGTPEGVVATPGA